MKRFSRLTRSLQSGFTLFELLVSISIIGLLIALATVSFSAAQSGARDSRRRGDLTSLRNAFEQYYSANNAYPDGVGTLSSELAPYLPGGLPQDPDPNPATEYTFESTPTSYCGCVLLEKEDGGNAGANDCSAPGSGDYFCIQNLQ